jgi:flagellar basal body-associated protein FliL
MLSQRQRRKNDAIVTIVVFAVAAAVAGVTYLLWRLANSAMFGG